MAHRRKGLGPKDKSAKRGYLSRIAGRNPGGDPGNGSCGFRNKHIAFEIGWI